MKSLLSIAAGISKVPDIKETLLGQQPSREIVKEVVRFTPAPTKTDALRVAQERQSAGKSIFVHSTFGAAELDHE